MPSFITKPHIRMFKDAALVIMLATWALFHFTDMSHAEHAHEKPVRLAITGTGTITAQPDIALISLGVLSHAETAKQAVTGNSTKMQNIFDALAKLGIEKKHISTSNFSLQPRFTHHRPKAGKPHQPPTIAGYEARNTVDVKLTDLEKLGTVLGDVVDGGSNQLNNIRFDFSNKQELLDQARKAAVKNARHKAELYAEAAGVELGDILAFREGVRQPTRRVRDNVARLQAEASAPVPVSTGESALSISITIAWEIEQ